VNTTWVSLGEEAFDRSVSTSVGLYRIAGEAGEVSDNVTPPPFPSVLLLNFRPYGI
jgi:hypothetical protein